MGTQAQGLVCALEILVAIESEDMRSTVVPNKEALKEKKEARDDDMAQVTPTFRHALQSDRRPVSWRSFRMS